MEEGDDDRDEAVEMVEDAEDMLLLFSPLPLVLLLEVRMAAGTQASSESSRAERVTKLRGQWSRTRKVSSLEKYVKNVL